MIDLTEPEFGYFETKKISLSAISWRTTHRLNWVREIIQGLPIGVIEV